MSKVVQAQISSVSWYLNRLLDSLVIECWLRVREVPGSIPSQGLKREILALSEELRLKCNGSNLG